MKIMQAITASTLFCLCFSASADNWYGKYDRGHKRSFKQTTEYWDGNCKVKRKVKKDGSYKEKRDCKGPSYGRNHAYRNNYYRGSHHNDAVNLLPAIIEPLIRAIN